MIIIVSIIVIVSWTRCIQVGTSIYCNYGSTWTRGFRWSVMTVKTRSVQLLWTNKNVWNLHRIFYHVNPTLWPVSVKGFQCIFGKWGKMGFYPLQIGDRLKNLQTTISQSWTAGVKNLEWTNFNMHFNWIHHLLNIMQTKLTLIVGEFRILVMQRSVMWLIGWSRNWSYWPK